MAIPVIGITNQSTVLTDDQVKAVIPALQKQVTSDFRAYWDIDATLTFMEKGAALIAGWWQIVIVDDPDQAGALGYHELSTVGTPLGKVFARLDIQAGQSWTNTLSHELLEMLADPWINWCAEGIDGKIYALEVCDPVEADELGYEIDGVLVSDFMTPAWFEPTEADRVDFKQHISRPLELAPGGYISLLDDGGNWIQKQAQHAIGARLNTPPAGSRRSRRNIPKSSWKKSEQ